MADLVAVVAWDAATARALLDVAPEGPPRMAVLLGDTGPAGDLLADRVVLAPEVTGTDPASVGPPLASLIPDAAVVLLDCTRPGRDLGGWLSVTLDAPLVSGIEAMRAEPGGLACDRRVLDGGHVLTQRVRPGGRVIVLARVAARPQVAEAGKLRSAPVVEVSAERSTPSALTATALPTPPGMVPLAGARTIVSVGRGVGGAAEIDRYRRLAERTGAALGASRAAVDSGWVAFGHQVGQTGASVAPDLYLAFGISGAVQHLAGMRASRRVVAVNTDPEAPICRMAHLVVVADANAVADELLRRLDGSPE
ncbi:hypothetical protein DP939_15910 [Spongiactinospora rosea]|uniref:Electron transfer flavoprotein alpha subunit C-terminal domain-containing protein n=1 Tax=Spongiactinospora rosea TaxID=2248750 RepID=A0A366LZP2_9ACTN|nr:electron transfer flavoprotein subunit alpha/FixB family protein [Spongiactinospora rosea]RBQ19401.1 hypothetical protein DP939_15910 [Spongiactinospora rosea]